MKQYSTLNNPQNTNNQFTNNNSSRQYNSSTQNTYSNPQINTHYFTMSQLKKKIE